MTQPKTTRLPLALDPQVATVFAGLLADRAGRPLDLDDARDLLDATIACRNAEEGTQDPAGDQAGLLFRTIGIGGRILHSPTLAARIKLQAINHWPVPIDWHEHPAEWISSLTGFILAHGREPAGIEALTQATAQPLVEAWITPMTCTAAELAAAVRDLAGQGYPPLDPEQGAKTRKKALGDPTPPPSSSGSPKPSPAATPPTGSTTSPRPTSTGSAAPPPTAPPSATPPSTPTAAPQTTPASTPANASNTSATASQGTLPPESSTGVSPVTPLPPFPRPPSES